MVAARRRISVPPRRGRHRRAGARPRAARRARQALAARPRRRPDRPRLALPGIVAARRRRHVRRGDPRRRPDHRHRPRLRPARDDRLQRRHGEGRHLLSDDGEEASSRPGDRAGEPAALHLPGRFRRRQPAAPDRGVSRPRSFRPHLLQPGPHVGGGHPADRLRHGRLHGGRRLCAGHERRDRHREGAGDDLPRRAASGEGCHRRDRQRRGTGRRRGACPPFGRRRPLRARRSARAGACPPDRRRARTRAPSRFPTSESAEPLYPASDLERIVPGRPPPAI